MFKLKGYRLHLVFSPADMRSGFESLNLMASRFVGIDVKDCKDCVVFVSRSRIMAKMIWADSNGSYLVTRKLNNGRFQQLLARIDAGENMQVSSALLLKYLDGEPILSKRTDFFQGC